MDYNLRDTNGQTLDARVELNDGRLVLHSRSGRSRTSPGRNPHYVAAFDAIFARINTPSVEVDRVLLDSAPAQAYPEPDRLLASRTDFEALGLVDVKNLIRTRMRRFGRTPEMPSNEGNQNKRIRVDTRLTDKEMVERLQLVPLKTGRSSNQPPPPPVRATGVGRLPSTQLRMVLPSHVQAALSRLANGETAKNFEPSRDYDALALNGEKFAPKKVFGLALEEALGIEAFPGHFSAGWGTPCFEILEQAGLWIVPKSGGFPRPQPNKKKVVDAISQLPLTDEERIWVEGNPKIAGHLKKERHPGLAQQKRAQFIQKHGKLFCEHCQLEPSAAYGPDAGPACIEVHHDKVQVADMLAGHETKLEDLKCLCANCHRVLHRALTLGVTFKIGPRKQEGGETSPLAATLS